MKKDYDAERVLQDLLDAVTAVYQEKQEIKAVALELNLAPLKVKKLLITAGVLVYPETKMIEDYHRQGIKNIEELMGLSRASINSYMPYSKIPYKGELSQNAERVLKYRERRMCVEKLQDDSCQQNLWDCIVAFQGYPFQTVTGLPFSYVLKQGKKGITKEIIVDRRKESKSLAWSLLLLAFRNILEGQSESYQEKGKLQASIVERPKDLGDIRGVSHIYPIFVRFGLIQSERGMQATQPKWDYQKNPKSD